MNKFLKVFLGVVLMFFAFNTFAEVKELRAIDFGGKRYIEKDSVLKQKDYDRLAAFIKEAEKLDNDIYALAQKNNTNPFGNQNYAKVFKNNDEILVELANGFYNEELIILYDLYYQNFLKNFKANVEQAHKLGDNRSQLDLGIQKFENFYNGMQPFLNALKKRKPAIPMY